MFGMILGYGQNMRFWVVDQFPPTQGDALWHSALFFALDG